MELKQINEKLSVSAQIEPSDLATLAQQGFGLVINNRPDGESADQPSSAQMEEACQALGLDYAYLPLVPNQITGELVEQYAQRVASSKAKVLAYCRTGNRSCNLWALGQDASLDSSQIIAKGALLGFSLEGLRPMLDAARA